MPKKWGFWEQKLYEGVHQTLFFPSKYKKEKAVWLRETKLGHESNPKTADSNSNYVNTLFGALALPITHMFSSCEHRKHVIELHLGVALK